MQQHRQASVQTWTGEKTSIWLALAAALGIHAIILFLPITGQTPVTQNSRAQIELQLTTFNTQASAAQEPKTVLLETVPEPIAEQQSERIVEAISEPDSEPAKPTLTSLPIPMGLEHDLDKMSKSEKSRLTNTILSRQFISEESAADQLFGKQLEQNSTESQKKFHYPLRQDMMTMLDKPMPELPFAYTPGLIHFAYDPGVKGDLQRFWDVITPEFGWRTKNGTEFKCIWVLIIGACGWK